MSKILNELKQIKNKEKAKNLARFFKTKKGQYGEGDKFLGITVPELRIISRKYFDLNFFEIETLLKNKYHEIRLVALLILVQKYKNLKLFGEDLKKKEIFNFYLRNTQYINNWDLVDSSAHYILGNYLLNKNKKVLEKLAKSKNIWERRISIISTFYFIYKKESKWTFKIVKILLNDQEDLIHKACGWMLREVGKRVSLTELKSFLDIYSSKMPRTMLRYSIERFSKKERLYYLKN